MLLNQNARERVNSMWVDEERKIVIMSDHNVLLMEYKCMKEKRMYVNEERNGSWKLRKVDSEKFTLVLDKKDWKI